MNLLSVPRGDGPLVHPRSGHVHHLLRSVRGLPRARDASSSAQSRPSRNRSRHHVRPRSHRLRRLIPGWTFLLLITLFRVFPSSSRVLLVVIPSQFSSFCSFFCSMELLIRWVIILDNLFSVLLSTSSFGDSLSIGLFLDNFVRSLVAHLYRLPPISFDPNGSSALFSPRPLHSPSLPESSAHRT